MKGKWSIEKIIGLILCAISIMCIIIAIYQDGNMLALTVSLTCNSISFLIFMFMNKKKR